MLLDFDFHTTAITARSPHETRPEFTAHQAASLSGCAVVAGLTFLV